MPAVYSRVVVGQLLQREEEIGEHGVDAAHGAEGIQGKARLFPFLRSRRIKRENERENEREHEREREECEKGQEREKEGEKERERGERGYTDMCVPRQPTTLPSLPPSLPPSLLPYLPAVEVRIGRTPLSFRRISSQRTQDRRRHLRST